MRNSLKCNIRGFFDETLRNSESYKKTLPLIALDECLNSKELDQKLGVLVYDGFAHGIERLWYQARETESGEKAMLHGSKVPRHRIFDIGKPVKNYSFPDADVICFLVAHFYTYSHIIFLTQDNKENQNGITSLLNNEVKPVINELNFNRYGLTAIIKKPQTSKNDLVAVVSEIVKNPIQNTGYEQINL